MHDYPVNRSNGAVDYENAVSLGFFQNIFSFDYKIVKINKEPNLEYYKLFPYVVFGLAVLGGCLPILWQITANKQYSQTEYMIDGLRVQIKGWPLAGLI